MKQEIGSGYEPFFIVGCPRSGTTLLQILLDAHPRLAIPPESHVLTRIEPFIRTYGDLRREASRRKMAHDILSDVRIAEWQLTATEDDLMNGTDEDSGVRQMVQRLFELYASEHGAERWGDKTPQHAHHLRKLMRLFPEAKVIHLVRDGRDVAESLRRVYIGPVSISGSAQYWRDYIRAVHGAVGSVVPGEQFYEVYYEDLVYDPHDCIRKVTEFLGERMHDIDDALRSDKRMLYASTVPHHASMGHSVTRNNVAVHEQNLSERDAEIFEYLAGAELEACGYGLKSETPAALTSKERARDALRDGVYRYVRKLGAPGGRKQLARDLRGHGQQMWRTLRREGMRVARA